MTSLEIRHRASHRIFRPEETLERIQRAKPIAGITRVADVTGLDHIGLPVVMVCRPNARSLSVCQGKGASLAAAEVSGLMESIEQFHAESLTLPLKLAGLRELRDSDHQIPNPSRLPRVATSIFEENLRILWIESRDLVSGARVWIPHELVHLDLTLPLPPGSGCFALSSNGLASGNHHFEAFIHGICELVERDAATLWHYATEDERRRTRLDLDTVDDPICTEVLTRLAEAGMVVDAWNLTSDLGIPAFRARIFDRSSPWHALPAARGMGCHPRRGVALSRALTEAAQSRLTLITGSRDDIGRCSYQQAPATAPESPSPGRVDFRQLDQGAGSTLDQDLKWLLDRLVAAGFPQVLSVDLTRKDLRIPVARMVIPGLEGYFRHPGFVPGPRLRSRIALREKDETGGGPRP